MSGATLAKSTMRFGTRLGIAAIALIVLGPFINRNFGVGDSLSFMPLPEVWESAPIAVLVSLTYLILLIPCAVLSAMLITTSLVIRHAEASEQATSIKDSTSNTH
jgi:SNF family Na+-dependent transporter